MSLGHMHSHHTVSRLRTIFSVPHNGAVTNIKFGIANSPAKDTVGPSSLARLSTDSCTRQSAAHSSEQGGIPVVQD
jgi:hypothetical protein